MKPHEETWELHAEDPESGPVIGRKGGGVLFDCNDKARATLARAAPEMARALLAIIADDERGHIPATRHIDAARAALAKAGVPLP